MLYGCKNDCQLPFQVINAGDAALHLLQSPHAHSPDVFYPAQIWRLRWPVLHPSPRQLLVQQSSGGPCFVDGSIVLLKDPGIGLWGVNSEKCITSLNQVGQNHLTILLSTHPWAPFVWVDLHIFRDLGASTSHKAWFGDAILCDSNVDVHSLCLFGHSHLWPSALGPPDSAPTVHITEQKDLAVREHVVGKAGLLAEVLLCPKKPGFLVPGGQEDGPFGGAKTAANLLEMPMDGLWADWHLQPAGYQVGQLYSRAGTRPKQLYFQKVCHSRGDQLLSASSVSICKGRSGLGPVQPLSHSPVCDPHHAGYLSVRELWMPPCNAQDFSSDNKVQSHHASLKNTHHTLAVAGPAVPFWVWMGTAVHSSALSVLSWDCRHMKGKQHTLCGQDLSSKASGLTIFQNLVIWQGF